MFKPSQSLWGRSETVPNIYRKARLILPGQPHHVIQRGNNRQNIFLSSRDFNYYRDKLLEISVEYECEIHAYVLMTNHTHMLITPKTERSLSQMMLKFGTSYVRYFNYLHERTGSLLEGRFKSSPITHEAYFLICMRYIELNPVRASMVKDPAEYTWSSYFANALGQVDKIVTPHSLYLSLGNTDAEREEQYKELFNLTLSEKDVCSNLLWGLSRTHCH